MLPYVYFSGLFSSWPGLSHQKWSFYRLISGLTFSWCRRLKIIWLDFLSAVVAAHSMNADWTGSHPIFHKTQEPCVLQGKATTMAFICPQLKFCVFRVQYMLRIILVSFFARSHLTGYSTHLFIHPAADIYLNSIKRWTGDSKREIRENSSSQDFDDLFLIL